ncbi:MAG: hypothetical protein MUC49_00395 [Raineya sp.]|jgi:WD40 repeat protein|nr:hypothetical protein [Raineya sp.]
MQKHLIFLVWAFLGVIYSATAQEVIAKRTVTITGKITSSVKKHFLVDEYQKGNFYARIALGNNIHDYLVNGEQIKTFSADVESDKHSKRINNLEIDADKKSFVSVDESNVIKVWGNASGLRATIQEKLMVGDIAINGSKLAYLTFNPSGSSAGIKVYDYLGKKSFSLKTNDLFMEVRFSPDGKYLMAYKPNILDGGKITVWDLTTRKIIFSETTNIQTADFTPNSKYFVYEAYKKIYKYGVDGKQVYSSEIGVETRKHTFSADSKYIYANGFYQFLKIDAETGKIVKQIEYKKELLDKLLFSSDGMYALKATENSITNEVNLTVFKMDW